MNVYTDDALVAELTTGLVARGHKIFQVFKAGDDVEHVSHLTQVFDLPQGAIVLDAGCGVGEVARLMHLERPDLEFVLLNISRAQLQLCPDLYKTVHCSFENVPLPDSSFDGIMFNYSLGHGDLDRVLGEAARLLKSGGIMLIYDLDGSGEVLGYQVRPAKVVALAASENGFYETTVEQIDADTADFRDILDGDYFDSLFGHFKPVIQWFVKC